MAIGVLPSASQVSHLNCQTSFRLPLWFCFVLFCSVSHICCLVNACARPDQKQLLKLVILRFRSSYFFSVVLWIRP